MSDAILEHWMPERDHAEIRAFTLARTRGCDDLAKGEVEADWVRPATGAASIDLLICRQVGPHVDNWHPEWSILWVLACGLGHTLHIADIKGRARTRHRKPAKALTQSAPLVVGQMVLFNAHCVHWLSLAEDGSALIVANFDFESRPTRDAITARLDEASRALATAGIAA